MSRSPTVFQSSPARGGGCNNIHARPVHPPAAVSILTRPWGRVQRSRVGARRALRWRFNPHPPVGAGATNALQAEQLPHGVSILTRPWGRVQRSRMTENFSICSVVSILTRPWGRVQRCVGTRGAIRPRCFNPHPPVGAGATWTMCAPSSHNSPFQSSPARGGGCNGSQTSRGVADDDSFNPHPPVGAGATVLKRVVELPTMIVSILTRPWGRVQPRYRHLPRDRSPCFNPHPPVGAGATRESRTHYTPSSVSILTRPWGRVQLDAGLCACAVLGFVSILTRPWGRVQLFGEPTDALRVPVSILTRPWGRVQHESAFRIYNAYYVSILTRPWGRVQPKQHPTNCLVP